MSQYLPEWEPMDDTGNDISTFLNIHKEVLFLDHTSPP